MARRIIIDHRCWICGDYVDKIPDKELMVYPHAHNAEFVVTHLGRKQYFHSKCWYGMIEEQKQHREELINHG